MQCVHSLGAVNCDGEDSSIAFCITRFSHGEKLVHVLDRASELHYLSSDSSLFESILRSLSKAVPFGVLVTDATNGQLES